MQNQASLQETKQHGAVRFPFNLYPCTIPGDFPQVALHWQESMELVFVKRGTGLVQVGAESCPARMGDIFIFTPGTLHALRQAEGQCMEYENIIFELELLGGAEDLCAEKYLLPLQSELAAAGVKPDVFFGFRDAPYCMEEYREIANLVKVSTDTGAVGFHGFVTQLYDPADYDVVLVCGPTVMMKNAARLCAEKGTPCFVSMEKKMACGIGACLGCTCETRGGEGKSVCKNGPVFDATEVFF